ncbi:hypothetical protein KUCAC02_024635 [Chaenocephalus aceratus]|uniref:Uncharacterized protein n=1 Tax=Chaenocephalus aceratus TaxID=36190 RepID=A0ACB9WJF2_CHAAC|nr:hypothetical protein KUCAC02_024635 [Chaenocephalus aceratus]
MCTRNSIDVRVWHTQRGDVSQIAASNPRARDMCPSAWHDYGRERGSDCGMLGHEATGGEQTGTARPEDEGRKNGWKAQLAAASNWAEQVSMADQSRMQHGSKEREGHKQSSRAGQAVGVWEGVWGCKAGERPGHTPAVTASL